MKRFFTFFGVAAFVFTVFAQAPAGYYTSAVGYTEAALKTKLHQKIYDHVERSYNSLWSDFQNTDKRADGKVWDMYSNCTFTFVTHQDKGSGGTAECQYFNREHSFPKSWFKDATPMYSDLFHLYPTDKYVNAQRGNDAFGETSSSATTYNNGSRSGGCTFPGYTGVVFEPIDQYKGDFARTYFYMVTAYENVVDTWNVDNTTPSPHLNSTKYPALNSWSVALFLKWNAQDPVSAKEISRNNAVYSIQQNRNPFIDHPELAEFIWGNKKGTAWSLTSGVDEMKVAFSISPNPVQNELIVKSNETDLNYVIFNVNGQTIKQNKLLLDQTISVDGLQNGVYLLQVSSGKRRSIQKFIVAK